MARSARSRAADGPWNKDDTSIKGIDAGKEACDVFLKCVGPSSAQRTTSGRGGRIISHFAHGDPMGPYVDSITPNEAFPASTGVVVIGGGIIGTSATLALAARGAIDVSDGLAQDLGHVARASGLRAILEEGVFLGTHAVIHPMIRVGAWSKIASGSVVNRNVPPNCLALGVPAKAVPMLRT